MSRVIVKSRLCNLRLYKFDVPYESDVGVILVSYGSTGGHTARRFQLSRYTGQGRGSKAGLSKSFVELVENSIDWRHDITKQIFDYIVSNFSFKDLEIVPPACPVLVFQFHTALPGDDFVPETRILPFTRSVLGTLRTRDSVLSAEDALNRRVRIAPPTTEIVDSYQSSELCFLCEKGYPKDDEIVHRTTCNHIFHATCISRYLLCTPHCPVCSAHLPPVDIRTLLFI